MVYKPVIKGHEIVIFWTLPFILTDIYRLDIGIKDHSKKVYILIDITVPLDKNTSIKEYD